MRKINVLAASLVFAATSFLSLSADAKTIKVGASPIPHAEVLEYIKPKLKEQGVDLEVVIFNDYIQPFLTTEDGQLDANYFASRPYYEQFTKDHNLKNQVEVAGIHIEPLGLYSSKFKSLNELKDGSVIAIPNEPTNTGRALLLLQSAGLITLEDPHAIDATTFSIVKNPKNLQFKEIESPQLPRALEDVDAAVINTNYALGANLNPSRDALVIEKKDSPYVNLVIANKESAQSEDLKKVLNELTSADVKKFIEKQYDGAVVPAF